MEGTLIGDRYRLSQPIGQGRGGFVWIAQDTHVQRTVAAKPIALRGPQDAAYALQQAKHAARLKHQSAVTVYDVLTDGPQVWIISEYVPSRTMSDFITSHGRLSAADTATLGTQLSAALAAAHEIGLLHRSVEPPHVLLADDGGVQIADFGIGALYADPTFQAPELDSGGGHTEASDVFSLGATLFYAVEGEVPFGEDGGGPSLRHLTGTPLQPVVMRMLTADPEMRPTMEGVWTALKAIAGGRPAVLAPATPSGLPAQQAPAAEQTQVTQAQPAWPQPSPGQPAWPEPAPSPPTGPQPAWPATATAAGSQPAGQPGWPGPSGGFQPGGQPAWPDPGVRTPPSGFRQAGMTSQAQAAPAGNLRALGLPSTAVIAAAVVVAVLVGVLFAELFLV